MRAIFWTISLGENRARQRFTSEWTTAEENGDWLPALQSAIELGEHDAGRVPVPFFRAITGVNRCRVSPSQTRSGRADGNDRRPAGPRENRAIRRTVRC